MGGRDFIGQHAHTTSQIYADDFEQPAYQGGSLTVTGALSGSVANVSSLQMPGIVAEGDPGQAVVGLILQRLGPFRVTFDELTGNAVSLADLPADTVVLRTWAEMITEWDGAQAGDVLIVGVSGFGATTNQYSTAIRLALFGQGPSVSHGVAVEAAFDDPTAFPAVLHVLSDGAGQLKADISITAPGAQGATDIYAIIATPAA